MMQPRQKAFRNSLILHGVILCCMLASSVSWQTPPPASPSFQVFEMADLPIANTQEIPRGLDVPRLQNPPPNAVPVVEEPPPAEEESTSVEPARAEPEPAVKETPAAPAEPPAPTPPPKPAAKAVTKPAPQTTAKAAPAPAAKKVSYADFIKKHKLPANTSPTAKSARSKGPVASARIDTASIRGELLRGLVDGTSRRQIQGMSSAQLDALSAYKARLRQRIQASWAPPPESQEHWVTEIRFTVTGAGVIQDTTIIRQSGHPGFDQSVLAAFEKAGRMPATPDASSYAFTLTFRLADLP